MYKLQLITEARRLCPEVIIVLGEDISRFRDASKELYGFLEKFSWSRKVERLGFDEVWMDVTDMVDYNFDFINPNDPYNAFFQLSKDDPTVGFEYNATAYAGHVHPRGSSNEPATTIDAKNLPSRLRLGSHLAMYLRQQLEGTKGYTSTVGISSNKLLAKLVGNLNKPCGQTTLLPPYDATDDSCNNAMSFIDDHDIGKIPGIGFKMAQKLREHVLQRTASFDFGLVYGGTRENVKTKDVRLAPDIDTEVLEKLLGGPGSPHGIGYRIWQLLHGVDDSEVGLARPVPRQISIEDSYIRLDTLTEVLKELNMLSKSLLGRMRIDLLGDAEDFASGEQEDAPFEHTNVPAKKWLAHPRTIRLSTRPKPPVGPDGIRPRTFKRLSHSGPLPHFVFNLDDPIEVLAEKLVNEVLVPMFRRLHPEKHGWNLSLVNVAVTNMAETAGESKTANGRDIGYMFKRQDDVLKDYRIVEDDVSDHDDSSGQADEATGQKPAPASLPEEDDESMSHDGEDGPRCKTCGLHVPGFAMEAHERFHLLGD